MDAIRSAGSNTAQLYIEVTKPTGDETVYKEDFAICGVRNGDIDPEDSIAVYLAKINPETAAYEEAIDTEGSSSWEIGANGIFAKNVSLAEGDNRFALAAYRLMKDQAALRKRIVSEFKPKLTKESYLEYMESTMRIEEIAKPE